MSGKKHWDQFHPYPHTADILNRVLDHNKPHTTAAWEVEKHYPLWSYTADPEKYWKNH